MNRAHLSAMATLTKTDPKTGRAVDNPRSYLPASIPESEWALLVEAGRAGFAWIQDGHLVRLTDKGWAALEEAREAA